MGSTADLRDKLKEYGLLFEKKANQGELVKATQQIGKHP